MTLLLQLAPGKALRAEGWDGRVDGIEGGVLALEHCGGIWAGGGLDEQALRGVCGRGDVKSRSEAAAAMGCDFGG